MTSLCLIEEVEVNFKKVVGAAKTNCFHFDKNLKKRRNFMSGKITDNVIGSFCYNIAVFNLFIGQYFSQMAALSRIHLIFCGSNQLSWLVIIITAAELKLPLKFL